MKVRTRYEVVVEVDTLDGINPTIEVIKEGIKQGVEIIAKPYSTFTVVQVDYIKPSGFLSGAGVKHKGPEFIKTENGLVLVGSEIKTSKD